MHAYFSYISCLWRRHYSFLDRRLVPFCTFRPLSAYIPVRRAKHLPLSAYDIDSCLYYSALLSHRIVLHIFEPGISILLICLLTYIWSIIQHFHRLFIQLTPLSPECTCRQPLRPLVLSHILFHKVDVVCSICL
jgi:hypothetical protein